MATKSQKRRERQIEARLRKAHPEVFCIGISFDDDGWMRSYLRPVDGGPSSHELYSPDLASLSVAEVAAMVGRWVAKELPKLAS